MTQFTETPQDSRFHGLILPVDTVSQVVRQELVALNFAGGGGAYSSVRRNNPAVSDWDYTNGSADADSIPDLSQLRFQSRDLSRNNPLGGGAVNTAVTNVVGTGIKPQSRVDSKLLGITDEAAAEWQSTAERLFWFWANSFNSDLTRTQNFWELQDLAFRSVLESGDCLVLRRFRERPGSPFGLTLQFIEADRIVNPIGKDADERFRAGVESDEDGAPVRYHIANRHPGEGTYRWSNELTTSVPAFDDQGQRLTLHLYRRTRIGQSRGIPFLAPVIESLKQLGRYTEAEITAAVISGMFAVAITTEKPSGPSLPMGVLPGAVPAPGTQPGKGSGFTKLKPGIIAELAPGEDIKAIDPNRPNTAFDPFVQAVLRQIGAQLEIPFELLIRHFTASYSASRAALLEAWKFFRARRAWLVANFNQPVWEWFLTEAIARGAIQAPGFFENPIIRAAWCNAEWSGSPMGQIDPLKEAKAAQAWLEMGATTLQQVTQEQFGTDWEENVRQRSREKDVLEEAGLWVDPNPVLPAPNTDQQNPDQGAEGDQ